MWAVFTKTSAVLAMVVAAATALGEDQMPWQPNLETAQRVAAETNRLVLIHFWAPWCRPCVRLEQDVFSNAATAKALEANFVMVKLNADEAQATRRLYGVSSLPSDVITTPSGQLVSQMQSPPTAAQYVAQMNQAAVGHRSLARKPESQSAQQIASPASPVSAAPVSAGAAYAPQGPPNASNVAGQPPSNPPAGPPAGSPYAAGSDRYAEYFPDQQHPNQQPAQPYAQPNSPAMPAYAAVPGAAPGGPNPVDPYAAPPPAQAPLVDPYAVPPAVAQAPPATAPYQAPPAAAPYQAPNTQPPLTAAPANYQPPTNLPQLPPGCPPIGLDGNCPVTLVERKRWVMGHPAYGVVHRGRTYLFLGPQEKDKFLADPDRYSPVLSGLDPVMALDGRSAVVGRREFGVFGADGHVYLFADEASRARFEQNEEHYSAAARQATTSPQYQAMRPPGR
jgi:YHS domain-containing protein/thiol-disulfide isomerase/thioredoxin